MTAAAAPHAPAAPRRREVRTAFLLNQLRSRFDAAPQGPPAPLDLAALRARRVLVVAPHPDDEVIGCGALVQKLAGEGAEVAVAMVTREAAFSIVKPAAGAAANRRVLESIRARRELGYGRADYLGIDELSWKRDPAAAPRLRAELKRLMRQLNPDLVLLPHFAEMHPDHRAVAVAGLTAIRELRDGGEAAGLERILLWEIWGACRADALLEVHEEAARRNERALECYRSQTETVDYQAIMRFLRERRAALLAPAAPGSRLAEAYQILERGSALDSYLQSAQD